MEQISEIFCINFFVIGLLVGLAIIVITNRSMDSRINLYICCFILLALALNIIDNANYFLSELPQPSPLRYVTSSAGYTLRPSAIVLIICLLLRNKRDRRFLFYLWMPVIILAVIASTSCFTHLMYWYDARNLFFRGPLGYLSHIISGFYMLLLVALTLRMYKNISAGEIVTIMYITLICTAATVIESVSDIKFLLCGAMLISCVMYYIFLCSQFFKFDVLTGLPNRRSFYTDMKSMGGNPFALIAVDLNGLKTSTTLGHSEGDRALQKLAEVLRQKSGKQFHAYRTGGDEFMLIGKHQTQKDAEALISGITAALDGISLSASFGCSIYHPGDRFDDVCNQADMRMYDDKSRYKYRTAGRDR